MSGNLGLPHTCPCCNVTTANTAGQLSALFGLRTVPSGATNQSWCRKCRSAAQKMKKPPIQAAFLLLQISFRFTITSSYAHRENGLRAFLAGNR